MCHVLPDLELTMAESIEVEGLHHGRVPIPSASRRGPLVASSRIFGLDPASGRLAEGEAQVETTFANIERVIAAAGGTPADIVRISVTLAEDTLRGVVDEAWLRRFPDPAARPSRHVDVAALRGPLLVQAEFTAYVERDES